MGKLDELNDRLYRKSSSFEDRQRSSELTEYENEVPASWEVGQQKKPADFYAARKVEKRRILLVIGGIFSIVLVAGIGFFLIFWKSNQVGNDHIELAIAAPREVSAGGKVSFEVRFKNRNTVALESVTLRFRYPQGSKPVFGSLKRSLEESRDIGHIGINQEHIERFEAYVFGKEATRLEGLAILEYRPTNSSARFSKETRASLVLGSSPLGVAIDMPKDASVGQDMEVKVSYTSTADTAFLNTSLEVLYPEGFSFKSATPQPTKGNNLWNIGDINPNETRTITIQGSITGSVGESKNFSARLGEFEESTNLWNVYNETSRVIALRSSLLAVSITALHSENPVARQGMGVPFEITWRNNLPVVVKSALIEVDLSGTPLDYSSITVAGGQYDGARKKILFTPVTEPKFRFLEAGASGTLTFNAQVIRNLPIRSLVDKNFTFSARARMYSNNIPEGYEGVNITGEDSITVKIQSELSVSARATYFDGPIQNSGPLPPKVDQETTYTITWSLTNMSNDLENISVRTVLPVYAKWKKVIKPESENVSFDPDTNEVVWNAGTILAGAGYSRPAATLSFQIGVTPGINHLGNPVSLLPTTNAQGKDTFVNRDLRAKSSELNSEISTDTKANSSQFKVVQ